ncbi:ABC transporter ATP-binding protein [Anaeromyxobacter oryzisoli]|uniref:ABC transporter ATP-binding protein n=1 Tax=Anaeromyxobacter oryzisoli TaxID=2925408 RepID=UPI001F58C615|nr:ABC transporter ATP-binding protein [Anaeromyxobacter sp. SG63]
MTTPLSTRPAIRVAHVTKSYRGAGAAPGLLALDDVSLDVRRGELLALLGPSGCGKSTLLHVIGGLVQAEGQVVVNGAPVRGPGLDRGIVFQDYALFPWRTVLANVAFGLEMKGLPAPERSRIAREQLRLVGLSAFEDRYPSQLSGGMKQRVALARALAFDPDVLLMDEPFAALDAQTRELLQIELLRVWERTGKTIVFVTHSIDEAVFLAQRVAVITARPGRVKEVLDVELPSPRHARDVRSTPEFTACRHALWELLSEEVTRASGEASAAPAVATPPRRGLLGAFARAFSRRAA